MELALNRGQGDVDDGDIHAHHQEAQAADAEDKIGPDDRLGTGVHICFCEHLFLRTGGSRDGHFSGVQDTGRRRKLTSKRQMRGTHGSEFRVPGLGSWK
jgi:hypothetical protein